MSSHQTPHAQQIHESPHLKSATRLPPSISCLNLAPPPSLATLVAGDDLLAGPVCVPKATQKIWSDGGVRWKIGALTTYGAGGGGDGFAGSTEQDEGGQKENDKEIANSPAAEKCGELLTPVPSHNEEMMLIHSVKRRPTPSSRFQWSRLPRSKTTGMLSSSSTWDTKGRPPSETMVNVRQVCFPSLLLGYQPIE